MRLQVAVGGGRRAGNEMLGRGQKSNSVVQEGPLMRGVSLILVLTSETLCTSHTVLFLDLTTPLPSSS